MSENTKKTADRTLYATRDEALQNKPEQTGKTILRLRPVTDPNGTTRFTWAADVMVALYNAAKADGYRADEPVDAKPQPTLEEQLGSSDDLEQLERLQKMIAVRKKALKAASTAASAGAAVPSERVAEIETTETAA